MYLRQDGCLPMRVSFNQDIRNWNSTQFFNMNYMFYKALKFNQNLTAWCVSNFSLELTFFADSALSIVNKPVWGICP